MKFEVKNSAVSGLIWSSIERFSTQGVQFVIGIVLARILLPSDFGLIGLISIFLSISSTFIDSGFSNALIQKQEKKEIDFSTVFVFNLLLSIFFYIVLYFAAPFISDFFEIEQLVFVIRIIALSIIFSGISTVSRTILIINIDFRTQAKISLISAILSGIIGIILSLNNFGVYALVVQIVSNSVFQSILFFVLVKWKPKIEFSTSSFKTMFSFGSNLLITNLLGSLYDNLYSIVIGKKFSTTELGYYSKSDQLVRLPVMNLSYIFTRVSFPILSKIKDDDILLEKNYTYYIQSSSLIIFPIMIGMIVLAKPLVILLFTIKWLNMVVILQILCFDWIWDHICKLNINLLMVKGKSDLILKLEISKRIFSISILFLSLPFGFLWVCFGRVVYSIISLYINSYYTGKLIKNLNFLSQLRLISKYLSVSIIMGTVVYFIINNYFDNDYLKLFGGIIIGFTIYTSLLILSKDRLLIKIINLAIISKNEKSI